MADVVDVTVGLQSIDHLVHWLLEAIGLLVVYYSLAFFFYPFVC